MRILIEHLKLRTIPHDLMDFFSVSNVPFYEGCMIVQVYDHKSAAPLKDSNTTKSGPGKTVPFSVHNYNQHLTPSPYVPYPAESLQAGSNNAETDKLKESGQKDKENMPAPATPADAEQGKSEALAKKPKVSTIVLYPTPVSNHADITIKAADSRSTTTDGRTDSRQETNGPLSATVPATPTTGVPQTPQASMAPPAKKQKKLKVELDSSNIHAIESQITLATTASLVLDTVSSAAEAAALLETLAHPMHSGKPPSPKTRKRTVAEMAADEALAVAQERYMLCFDERLSSNTAGAQGGANQADGDGQAGGASFEPRFERFKTLENIKIQLEENKKAEKARQLEVERKNQQDRERERLRVESEKRESEKLRQQQMQQEATRRQQEAHRRVMSAGQSQPGLQGVQGQGQGQHGHPQPNNIMANGIPGQPQRFHQQQVSQAQLSSPIVRNGTPQSHMSPVNNMGNIPMQHSTSSIGGSPPRPGSAVHMNPPQMGAQTPHNMTAQRSQQSHGGTPRMPNATPNLQSTPLSRQVSVNQTPRMSQASPLPGQLGQVPHMQQVMGPNGQPINLNPAQQQQFQQQQALFQQRMRQQAATQGIGMNGQQMTQQQMMQAQQMLRAQQTNQMNSQMAQNYTAQMAAMQRAGGMPQNVNFANNPQAMQNLQQMQQMQQMQQLQQLQLQAQAQAQAQAQQHPQQATSPQAQQQLMMRKAISGRAHQIYQQQIPQFQAQYPGGIPDDVIVNLRRQCNQTATVQITQQMNAQRMQQQQQMMAAAQQHGGMQNGMGMQRPQ
jgi:transcription factor SPT20